MSMATINNHNHHCCSEFNVFILFFALLLINVELPR